jgi:LmbE family N-acetylglucosaminyl deacetylase
VISLFDKSRPVLVLSPHPDDAELGCGGTIARLRAEDFEVLIVHMAIPSTVPNLKEEAEASALVLDAAMWIGPKHFARHDRRLVVRHFPQARQAILEGLVQIRDEFNPGCVFTPATTDVHQDHKTVTEEAFRAFRHRTILGYYEPWNTPRMEPDIYVTLSGAMVKKKLDALECYTSQRQRPYFGETSMQAVLRTWGLQAGSTWSEAFELIRGVVT